MGPARGESRDRDRDEDRPRNTSTRNDNGDDRRTTRPRDRDDDTPAQRSTTPTRKAEPSPPPARSASTGAAALVTGSTGAALTGAKWSHNNSTMRFENQGETMRVLYDQPKSGLAGLGIAPGTPLFDGKKTGANSYAGEATTFSKSCGPAKFQVAGDLSGDGRRLVLRGQKPERGSNCQVSGYRPETLSFEVAR